MVQEHGVDNAIQALYRDLEYAKTLIKHRQSQSLLVAPHPSVALSAPASSTDDLDDDEAAAAAMNNIEESWTFIGDESDPELVRRIQEWDPAKHLGSLPRRSLTGKEPVGKVEGGKRLQKRGSLKVGGAGKEVEGDNDTGVGGRRSGSLKRERERGNALAV